DENEKHTYFLSYFYENTIDSWSYSGFINYAFINKLLLFNLARSYNNQYKKYLDVIEQKHGPLSKENLKCVSLLSRVLYASPCVSMKKNLIAKLSELTRKEIVEEYKYQTSLNTHVREEKQLYSGQQLELRKRSPEQRSTDPIKSSPEQRSTNSIKSSPEQRSTDPIKSSSEQRSTNQIKR
ncbi:28471_t:CDS:2, partial [Racocetra persica]